jgi:predicted nucleic acid-binding protein
MALIVDTGPLLAGLDRADPDHQRCATLLTEAREDLVVPALVLAELDYWCHERLGLDAWTVFLEDLLAGVYREEAPTRTDLERARDLQLEYEDLAIGLVDATVVALAERLQETRIATLDRRHFGTVRPAHANAFELVPA